MKISWTPISPSGFHPLAPADLLPYFADDFDMLHQAGRQRMVSRLLAYLAELAAFQLPMEIWLDGSFTTRCPEPDDIDLVVLLAPHDVDRLSPAQQSRLSRLLNERERVRIRYECDVYHVNIQDAERRRYWTRTFATNHDGTTKGIFTLTL
ncbi:MAG: DUF6932 family protein [Janthinobacterium lividum]